MRDAQFSHAAARGFACLPDYLSAAHTQAQEPAQLVRLLARMGANPDGA